MFTEEHNDENAENEIPHYCSSPFLYLIIIPHSLMQCIMWSNTLHSPRISK